MAHAVVLTTAAKRDLEAIWDYIAENDSEQAAQHVLDHLFERVRALSELPERGARPQEMVGLGGRDLRQIFFKPYRVLYRVRQDRVIIVLVADGRRDMRRLLQQRLLSG